MKKTTLLSLLLFIIFPVHADQFVNGQAADVVLGQPDFVSRQDQYQPNRFTEPVSVAFDPATGKVFVGIPSHFRILRYSSMAAARSGSDPEAVFGQSNFNSYSSNQGGSAGPNTLEFFSQIMVDRRGRLWVADTINNRVLCWFAASYRGNGDDADYVFGQPNFTTTTAGTDASKMDFPTGVWVDDDDTLWVAERKNNRVLRFDEISGKNNGAAADGVLGQFQFTSSTSATSTAGMNSPRSVSVDSSGRLWVADRSNNRILRFDAAASKKNGSNADGVLGQPDFVSSGSARTATTMNSPSGVLATADGTVWVGDYLNGRVLGFADAAALPDGAPASTVLGQPDFVTRNTTADARTLGGPWNLSPGPAGSLFVVDFDFNRVLRYTPFPTPAVGVAPAAAALNALRAQLLNKAKKLKKKAKKTKKKGQKDKAKKLNKKAKKLLKRARSI